MFQFGGQQWWTWLLWGGILAIVYYLFTGTMLTG